MSGNEVTLDEARLGAENAASRDTDIPQQASRRTPRPSPLRDHHLISDEGLGPWAGKTVLAFGKLLPCSVGLERLANVPADGGGVRGYSSLLILKRLMEVIREVELQEDHQATSSAYYPWQGAGIQNGFVPPLTDGIYLPCHYFDYMAGTSTGGCVDNPLATGRALTSLQTFSYHAREAPYVSGRCSCAVC